MSAVLAAAIIVAPASQAAFKVYCIDGASDDAQWAWKITGTGDSCQNLNTGPVTPSGNELTDEQQFAIVFRDSINGACASAPSLGITASVSSESQRNTYCPGAQYGSAFGVQSSGPIDLSVGPAGSTPSSSPCIGGSNGIVGTGANCNFNPQIIQGTPSSTNGTPGIGGLGAAILIVLMLAGAAWVMRGQSYFSR